MRGAWSALLVACAVCGANLRTASAEPEISRPAATMAAMPEHVVLRRSDCSPLPFREEALASRLRVELVESGVRSIVIETESAGAEAEAEVGRMRRAIVTILGACSGGELTVTIDAEADLDARCSVDLSETDPAHRERALALAIAELLRARWAELSAGSAEAERAASTMEAERSQGTALPSSVPAPAEESRSASPALFTPRASAGPDLSRASSARPADRSGAPTLFSAGIEWRFLLQHNAALTGGRIAASLPAGSDWIARLSVEAGAFYDSEDDGASAIELWLVTGGLGASVGYGWESAEIGVGPRLEIGWGGSSAAVLEPSEDVMQSKSALILVGSAVVTGRVRLAPRLWLSMDLEIGHMLRGVETRQLDRSPPEIRGIVSGGRLGVALAL